MSKFRYPKCPYCGSTYVDKPGEPELMRLATQGWIKEETVRCHNCDNKFRVTIKLMYYGSKL